MNKIALALKHAVRGTLRERLRSRSARRKVERLGRSWRELQAQTTDFDFKLPEGCTIRLFTNNELCRVIFCEDFERAERDFVCRFLKMGDTFVDVGANIGLFSLVASKQVGEHGRIYSLEPAQRTFANLIQNVNRNHMKNIKCFQIALSDTTGEVALYSAQQGFDAWNSLAKPYDHEMTTESIETVRSMTWADFADAEQLIGNVALMKIDVEGWESNVLNGGKSAFERDDAPVLILEFTDGASQSAGHSCRELYKRTEALGYTIYKYDHRGNFIVHDPIRENYPYVNLIAAKDIEAVRIRIK